ncbi:hypothetical protein CR513_39749, partial [Mucuna pruriens]
MFLSKVWFKILGDILMGDLKYGKKIDTYNTCKKIFGKSMSRYYPKRNCIGSKNLDVNGFNLEIIILDFIIPLQLCEGREIRLKLCWIKGRFLRIWLKIIFKTIIRRKVSTFLGNYRFLVIEEVALKEVEKSFFDDEIQSAVFSMSSFKALRLDGLHPIFFQSNWPMVGSFVFDTVHSYYYEPDKIQDINSTLLVLIPKCDAPTSLHQFRPISLCNVKSLQRL